MNNNALFRGERSTANQPAGGQSSSHRPSPTPPPGEQLHSASRSQISTHRDASPLAEARGTSTSSSSSGRPAPARSPDAALRQTLDAQLTPAMYDLPDAFNFWAPGGVRTTLKRLECGGLLVDRLERILAARAALSSSRSPRSMSTVLRTPQSSCSTRVCGSAVENVCLCCALQVY